MKKTYIKCTLECLRSFNVVPLTVLDLLFSPHLHHDELWYSNENLVTSIAWYYFDSHYTPVGKSEHILYPLLLSIPEKATHLPACCMFVCVCFVMSKGNICVNKVRMKT